MSRVIVHRHAAKYLQRLPKSSKQHIKDILKSLENNPLGHPDAKPLLGEWAGYHRMRSGKFRIIFWYDEGEDMVYVDHIGPRGDVYK